MCTKCNARNQKGKGQTEKSEAPERLFGNGAKSVLDYKIKTSSLEKEILRKKLAFSLGGGSGGKDLGGIRKRWE